MDKKELKVNITIQYEPYETNEVKEKLFEFLKDLDVIKLEMEDMQYDV